MAVVLEFGDRRVVPNWRDFRRTQRVGELASLDFNRQEPNFDLSRSISDWNENPSIGSAADLITSAYVSGLKDNIAVAEALAFLGAHASNSSKSLKEIASILNTDKAQDISRGSIILEANKDTITEFQAFINNASLFSEINTLRSRTRSEMRNPINWIELARYYTMQGHIKHATRAIHTALHLDPNSRYILRSATRYFIHIGDFDKALHYLKRSDSTRTDPWLISAHIATSTIIGRTSIYAKKGQRMIDSKQYHDSHLTELASSLGTLELLDGSYKKAKKNFDVALRAPNDNTLAQLEWVANSDPRFHINPFHYSDVVNPFEAHALANYDEGNWAEAFYNCINWFLDTPFSKRPAITGSYIAGSLLQDPDSAILLCKLGLKANPYDPTLLNNLIYYTARDNRLDEAEQLLPKLEQIKLQTVSQTNQISLQATLGLVAMRLGRLKEGTRYYEQAITNAEKIGNEYLRSHAIMNYTWELILAESDKSSEYVEILKNMKIEDSRKDLLFERENIINTLNNSST